MPGFRTRTGQNTMIATVARTLAGEFDTGTRILFVEGPTGTGKSLGYLLPALLYAAAEGKTLVVATATVALQEQLAGRDIPALAAAIGLEVDARVAKGRQRYLCPRNLALATRVDPAQAGFAFGPAFEAKPVWADTPTGRQRDQLAAIAEAWSSGRWAGDLDTLSDPLDPAVKQVITTTGSACLGAGCPQVSQCPALGARSQAKAASVIVTNHALLLANVAHGHGGLLPDLADTVLVIDEAHDMPVRARDAFAATCPLEQARRWVAQAARACGTDKAGDAAGRLADTLEAIDGMLRYRITAPPARRPAETGGERAEVLHVLDPVWDDLRARAGAGAAEATQLAGCVATAREEASRRIRAGSLKDAAASARIAELADALDRLQRIEATLANVARQPSPHAPPMACWVELGGPLPRGREWMLCTSPVSVGDLLRSQVLLAAHAVVLTSATLRSLGSFATVRAAFGVPGGPGVQELALDSPFDLERQGRIWVPPEAVDPRQADAHDASMALIVARYALEAGAGGTLVLFTSRRQLQVVERGLSAELRSGVQTQLDGARQDVLDRHAARVAQGQRAVLFGLGAFAEGLDLPGALCRRVIVARLPFPAPDSPVEQVHERWLQARGRSYFTDVALPECARRLTQMAGRLVRTETDTGDILVADTRLATTRYGEQLMDGLPGFARGAPGGCLRVA
jgi:ATP-dependent DNA helicase DinG